MPLARFVTSPNYRFIFLNFIQFADTEAQSKIDVAIYNTRCVLQRNPLIPIIARLPTPLPAILLYFETPHRKNTA